MRRFVGRILFFILFVALCLNMPCLDACTTFCIKNRDHLVFGRNYDWGIGVGIVFVNKRDLSKKALVEPTNAPAEWISKYGSITFNQYGRELPMGGINEVGLVVEQMWMSGTQYPDRDERPTLRELAWIQYHLDTSQSVHDVLASDSRIRILGNSVPVHFLVCDKTGQVAAIEFLKGKMVVHTAKDLPVAVLANSTYAESIQYLKRFKDFGGSATIPKTTRSLDRFARTAQGIIQFSGEQSEGITDYAFKILDEVSQGSATQWSIVYDVKSLALYFKTSKSPRIKNLALKDIDFSPGTPSRTLDINTSKSGNVGSRFVDYSTEINKKLIFESWKKIEFLKNTPDEVLNELAEYPESIRNKAEDLKAGETQQ